MGPNSKSKEFSMTGTFPYHGFIKELSWAHSRLILGSSWLAICHPLGYWWKIVFVLIASYNLFARIFGRYHLWLGLPAFDCGVYPPKHYTLIKRLWNANMCGSAQNPQTPIPHNVKAQTIETLFEPQATKPTPKPKTSRPKNTKPHFFQHYRSRTHKPKTFQWLEPQAPSAPYTLSPLTTCRPQLPADPSIEA